MGAVAESARPLSRRAKSTRAGRFLRANALQVAIVLVLVVLWLFFTWRSPETWLEYDIYNSLMTTTPYFAMIAIPVTLVIIAKEIDLSFTSIMAWGMCAFDLVFVFTGNIWLGFFACLAAGLFAGLVNGVLVVRLGIPSLVTTIGTMFLWRGMVMVLTNGQGLGLQALQDTFLYNMLVGRVADLIPMQFLWTIVFAIVTWFFLNRHRFGAHVYLTGDNAESARLMGVNVNRTRVSVFAISGFAAAFAGFVQSASLLYYWPTLGDAALMNTLASIFLGGTSVFGGTGTIFGTFVASFIIAIINPGIVAAGWTSYLTQVIYGLIIVVSVGLQAVLRRRLE
jgi:simple sugar transport system permease protein